LRWFCCRGGNWIAAYLASDCDKQHHHADKKVLLFSAHFVLLMNTHPLPKGFTIYPSAVRLYLLSHNSPLNAPPPTSLRYGDFAWSHLRRMAATQTNSTPPTYHSQSALGYDVPKWGGFFAPIIVCRPKAHRTENSYSVDLPPLGGRCPKDGWGPQLSLKRPSRWSQHGR
jgi:hypothetical protein